MARVVLIGLMLLLSTGLVAESHISHERKLLDKKFESQDTCGLSRFSLATYDNEYIDFLGRPGRDRHRMMAAIWETTDPSCMKDYGIVQYIRGCIYKMTHDPSSGEVDKWFGVGRESRGQFSIFRHKEWEVDSVDVDPLYSSYEGEDATREKRFNWHKFPLQSLLLEDSNASLEHDGAILFHGKNYDYLMNLSFVPQQVFITDLPGGSSYNPANAHNEKDTITVSSLEFKTCLYATKDIPLMSDPAAFDVDHENGGPVHCYDWSDKVEVDLSQKKFVRAEKIDEFCL